MPQAWPCKRTTLYSFCLLAQGQIVSAHLGDFMHMRFDEKRDLIETILVITIQLTCWRYRSRRERIIAVLWVLVQRLLYSRHVRFAQKEQLTTTLRPFAKWWWTEPSQRDWTSLECPRPPWSSQAHPVTMGRASVCDPCPLWLLNLCFLCRLFVTRIQ